MLGSTGATLVGDVRSVESVIARTSNQTLSSTSRRALSRTPR
jgi:hypothetical protein